MLTIAGGRGSCFNRSCCHILYTVCLNFGYFSVNFVRNSTIKATPYICWLSGFASTEDSVEPGSAFAAVRCGIVVRHDGAFGLSHTCESVFLLDYCNVSVIFWPSKHLMKDKTTAEVKTFQLQ